jgi:hypothetical protein
MRPDITNIPITHAGKNYMGKDLPPEIQEILQHCVALREKREDLEFEHTQLLTAENAMQAALVEKLTELTEQVEPQEEKVANG